MYDYKAKAVEQIMLDCISEGFTTEQSRTIQNIATVALYNFDLFPKEDTMQLPATVNEHNAEIVKRFFISKAISGLSEKSLKNYRSHIASLCLAFSNKKLSELTSDDLKYYLAMYKLNNNAKDISMNNKRRVLNSLFNWMHKEEYISKNPMDKIERIKTEYIKEEPFSETDIEKIKKACTNLRDRAIIEFLLASGCRVSEMCSVNISDIDFISKQFTVIGKGNKQRTAYLTDKAIYHIKMYLETRRDKNDALFVYNREPFNKLSDSAVQHLFRDIGKRAGVEHVHPHRFRRTLCCTLVNRGMNIQDVKEVLGHSNINTTMIYYNNNNSKVKSNYNTAIGI